MKTLFPDTDSKTEQFHIELIRKAPFYRRLQLVSSLIKTTRLLTWNAICERYPDETFEFCIERLIYLLYDDEYLAREVKNCIKEKNLTK
jgi:hypothetical protein